MKHNSFLFVTLFIYSIAFSQIGPQTVISDDADQPQRIIAADMDGDGDLDILSANQFDNGVSWFENIDGNGNFGAKRVVTDQAIECQWVDVSDIDGDGDLDVLSASWVDNKIAWYENVDGFGNFGTQQVITNTANTAESVSAADLDGDGDMDVISASSGNAPFRWYENINGNGDFNNGTVLTMSTNGSGVIALPVDLDDDGDMDIVASSTGAEKVHWYENLDGAGNFSENILITDTPTTPWNISIDDIDGDNDLDIAIITLNSATIYWVENTDGQGNFSLVQTITTSLFVGYSIELIDIDNDEDLDLFTVYGGSTLSWHENTDGLGTFGPEQFIDTNINFPTSVTGGDLNGDEREDVLVTGSFSDELYWYENLFPLSINDEEISQFTIFPIPTSGILNISAAEEINSIAVYTMTGQKMLKNAYQESIDLSTFSKGIYVLEVTTTSGKTQKQRIIKQ